MIFNHYFVRGEIFNNKPIHGYNIILKKSIIYSFDIYCVVHNMHAKLSIKIQLVYGGIKKSIGGCGDGGGV